jgi:hypothetical protein
MYATEMASSCMIQTKFHKEWCGFSSSIKVLSQKCERLQCWYYWWYGSSNKVLLQQFERL